MALISPSSYWRKVNPVGAVADFREVYRQAGHNRWRFALAAAATTFAIFAVIWQEEMRGPPARPVVTIIKSWPADRGDAEIIRTNIENQKRKERLAAEQAQRDEDVRKFYKELGRASGMDVAAIEKQAQDERTAAEAATKAAAQSNTGQPNAPAQTKPTAAVVADGE
jgi:hypothetical protein